MVSDDSRHGSHNRLLVSSDSKGNDAPSETGTISGPQSPDKSLIRCSHFDFSSPRCESGRKEIRTSPDSVSEVFFETDKLPPNGGELALPELHYDNKYRRSTSPAEVVDKCQHVTVSALSRDEFSDIVPIALHRTGLGHNRSESLDSLCYSVASTDEDGEDIFQGIEVFLSTPAVTSSGPSYLPRVDQNRFSYPSTDFPHDFDCEENIELSYSDNSSD